MYCPRMFEESDRSRLIGLVRRHPLATLVRMERGGLCADHIPMLAVERADGSLALQGHVARANPLWRDLGVGAQVLAIFQDPGCYITPSWYATKAQGGKVVPTWNYAAVHAHGVMRPIEDLVWLRSLLERLTASQESARPQPWQLADAPAQFVVLQMRAIVGVELYVQRLEGKWKVSQNRLPQDIDGVVAGLRKQGDSSATQMAQWVEQRRPR